MNPALRVAAQHEVQLTCIGRFAGHHSAHPHHRDLPIGALLLALRGGVGSVVARSADRRLLVLVVPPSTTRDTVFKHADSHLVAGSTGA